MYSRLGHVVISWIVAIMLFVISAILIGYLTFLDNRLQVEITCIVFTVATMVSSIVALGLVECRCCQARIICMIIQALSICFMIAFAWMRVYNRIYLPVVIIGQYIIHQLNEAMVTMWVARINCELGAIPAVTLNLVGIFIFIMVLTKCTYHFYKNA